MIFAVVAVVTQLTTGTVRAKAEHELQAVEQKWDANDARRSTGAAFADASGFTTAFKGFTGTDPYKGSDNAYAGKPTWHRVWDAGFGSLEVLGNATGLAGGIGLGLKGIRALAASGKTLRQGWQIFGAWAGDLQPLAQESRAVWRALSHPVQSGRAVGGYLQDAYVAARGAIGDFTAGGVRATAQRSLQFAKDEILPRFNPRNYARNGWDVDFVGQRTQGTARIGRLDWQPNSDGRTRTIDEAIEIARANGVEIPDDIHFVSVGKSSMNDSRAFAEYGFVKRRGADDLERIRD